MNEFRPIERYLAQYDFWASKDGGTRKSPSNALQCAAPGIALRGEERKC